LHDSLTNSPGSFKQLEAGLYNIKKLKIKKIGSNTTIVKQNYKFLPEIGKFIQSHGIKNSEFIFVDCNYGAAKLNFHKLVPKISQAAPYIRSCLDIGRDLPHWHARYVPLCYFKDYLKQISEIDEVRKFNTEHIAPDFINLAVESSRSEIGRAKTNKCKPCKLYNLCEGIWKEYLKNYGDKELKPML
jgi:MoaA/NifB/PqqE/SkfB family radical SAM enzyme